MLPVDTLTGLRDRAVSLLDGSVSGSDDPQAFALVAAAFVAVLGTALWLSSSPRKAAFKDKNGRAVKARAPNSLPGSLPVLGDLLTVAPHANTYHSWVLSKCREYDFQPWTMKMPGQAKLHIFSDPEQYEEVLSKQFDNFPKGPYHVELLQTYFGKSLVGSDGELWYHQRKTAVKFFTARTLRAYMATSAKRNLIQVMDIIASKQKESTTVNLTTLFQDFTMQTFVETGLGERLDWIGRAKPHAFQHAIDEGSILTANRFNKPRWFWRLQKKFGLGEEGKLAAHMVTIRSFLTGVVNKSIEASFAKTNKTTVVGEGGEETKSLIELFAENSREDAEGIRSEDLVDFIQVMVIAARDTTAIALTWFFYELSVNPAVEAKIRSEMATVFPSRVGKKDNYFTPEDARSLVYLEATLKESLRLHPPGPFMLREVAEDTVICDDILLRQGELIGMPVYTTARNPKVWGPDAEEFNPARWIDESTGELKNFPSTKFATFSSGPRACVGMSLAMLELRVVAANLLSRFRFDLATKLDGSYEMASLLNMKDPIIVHVRDPVV